MKVAITTICNPKRFIWKISLITPTYPVSLALFLFCTKDLLNGLRSDYTAIRAPLPDTCVEIYAVLIKINKIRIENISATESRLLCSTHNVYREASDVVHTVTSYINCPTWIRNVLYSNDRRFDSQPTKIGIGHYHNPQHGLRHRRSKCLYEFDWIE